GSAACPHFALIIFNSNLSICILLNNTATEELARFSVRAGTDGWPCLVAWVRYLARKIKSVESATSVAGPSRHFAAKQQFGRFRREADIQRAALTEPDF